MKTSHFDIQAILAREGVIALRDHPDLIGPIRWLVRRGNLHGVLPGVYAPRVDADTFDTRIRALRVWCPECGSGRRGGSTCLLLAHNQGSHRCLRAQAPSPAATRIPLQPASSARRACHQSSWPPLHLSGTTALDLCESHGGDAIDEALRARATTLKDLHRALQLTSARLGNAERRRLLLDSKDEPWSAAERRFHRLLRAAGIAAWKANRPVLLSGSLFFLDVVLRGVKLVIEIDGRLYHSGSEVFETDRLRQNLLILDGWCVLRFTSAMIDERPEEVIAMVRAALEMLGAA